MAFTGTIIDGSVDTEDILDLDEAVDVDPDVAILEDDESRFTKFLMTPGLKKRTTFSIKPQWLEDELLPRTSALIAGPTYSASNTDFKVTAGQWNRFRVNDVIKNETTNEFSVVTAINSATDTLTVIRAVGSTAGTPAAGHVVFIVSNAFPQGSDIGEFRITKKVGLFNYTQIFRHAFSFTRTMKGQKYISGDPVAYQTRLQMLYHRRAMEHQFTVGGRDLLAATATAGPRGIAGGLFYYITTNVTLTMGAFVESAFETFARSAFQYDSGTKLLLASPNAISRLNTFPAGKLSIETSNPQADIKKYGISVQDMMTGLGDTPEGLGHAPLGQRRLRHDQASRWPAS